MKKLIATLVLFLFGLSNAIAIQAETITFDTSDMVFKNFFSNVFGYELRANRTEFGGNYINFTVPTTNQILYEDGGIVSNVILYEGSFEEGNVLVEIDAYDLEPVGPYPNFWFGRFSIDMRDYLTDAEIEKVGGVKLTLMTNFQVPPSGFAQFLEDNVGFAFTDAPEPPTITFIHQGDVLYETTYVGFIDPPPNEPLFVDGYAFDYWVDQNGDIVNFSNPYSGDQIFYSVGESIMSIQYYANDVFVAFDTATRNTPTLLDPPTPPAISGQEFLWWEIRGDVLEEEIFYTFNTGERINAVYQNVTEIGITAPDAEDQPFNALIVLLEGFGLNNQFGYIVIMLLIFLPINLFLAWVKVGTLAIAITNFGLIALFLYMQFMPFWFIFILILAIATGIIAFTKGVVNLE